ncbi:DUF2271 domain-containing protein [Henriciella algicola]|uniref:DUF2271 domain-containing protein n=1 Tax=Henriciella algicola TaxID=1608422 RepID=A0A399RLY7_9PROT|nr:DUF2271 domain-containing protein [Henriciella algicola]RIJ30849.1 DUF2271 domain-containing protein [Henriciella algicola]
MRSILTLAGLTLAAGHAAGEGVELEIEIPRLDVAEYHRPYVAVWVARPDHSVVSNVAVWYQQESRGAEEGETWLKDLRQWWRRAGRSLDMPVDGVSGPTQAPGKHTIDLGPNTDLEPGDYQLVVEAAREVGGRELVTIPFSWPLAEGTSSTAEGERELGTVILRSTAP